MPDINAIKDDLINQLWLRIAKEGGKQLIPRLRTNKKMKTLTLTNDTNYNEIPGLISSQLTQKPHVYAWNHEYFKFLRLETEGIANKVLGTTRYEDSVNESSCELLEHFPFDLVNLDFSSQDPESENGRLEREINGIEATIKLQKERRNAKKGYVLIYTTLINSKELDCSILIQNCRSFSVSGWTQDIQFNGNPTVVTDCSTKVGIVESILNQLSEKYGYDIEIEKMELEQEEGKRICSIAGIIKYR